MQISTTSRYLNIQEICQRVAGHVNIDQGGLSSLVALALTCRAFKEPALDALWSDIKDISPYIRLFPDDAWELNLAAESETIVRCD